VQTLLHGVAIVGGAVLLALVAMAAVRRSSATATLEAHTEVAGFVYAVLGVIYAVLLAFVVLAVWEGFERAELHAEQEANALADLHRLAEGLPAAERDAIQSTLLAYARAVRDEEWDAMAGGAAGARARGLTDELWGAYRRLEPRTDRERALHGASLARLTDFADARRLRLYESRNDLPGILWMTLIVGGAITVGFSLLFGVRSARSQGVITGLLAAMVALLLFVLHALDQPFRGDVQVRPEAFERALDEMTGGAGLSGPAARC
jgi:tetrahydromethanopterin S-methyltransferase subunit F